MLSGNKRITRLLLAATTVAVLAATFLAYFPGLHGDFMFDDIPNIVRNPGLPLASLAPHELLRAAFSTRSGPLYRPLSMLSFALNEYFFGPRPFSFKLVNVLVHLVNAMLLLWLTWRLLVNCRKRYSFQWTDAHIAWASVVIAAAWSLHPLNLTSVLFVVQRMTSLAALFTLAGMLAYIHGRERMQAGKTGWPLVWLLTPFFGILGVLSKEDAALLPLYLLVVEWLIFGFRGAENCRARNIYVFFACGLILPGLLGSTFLGTHPGWFLGGYTSRNFTLGERLLTELRVVCLYIRWTFIPDIRQLALYHDDIVASRSLLHPLTTTWSLLALIALVALAIWQRTQRPLLTLGILFFFAGQMIESTILPLELAFEHRNYLPDYGLLLAFFSWLLLPASQGKHSVRLSLRWTMAALTLPVLFSATLLRAWEWKNPLSFAYYEAQHHPTSQRALYALGQAYSDMAMQGAISNPDIALQTLTRAAAVSDNIMPDVAMMIVSAKLDRAVNPSWEKHAAWLLQNRAFTSQDTNSLYALVNCLPVRCKVLEQPAGMLLHTALQPGLDSAKNPDVWVIYANYLTFTDQPLSVVLSAIEQSVRLAPATPQYRLNLAKGLIVAGDFSGAKQQIQALTRLNFLGHLDSDIQLLNTQLSTARAEANKVKANSG